MGRTATTLGVVLVFVLLGVVVLIVWSGGNRSSQASAKPSDVASITPDKKAPPRSPVNGNRIIQSGKPKSLTTTPAPNQNEKKAPSPAPTVTAPSAQPPKTEPPPPVAPQAPALPAPPGDAGKAPATPETGGAPPAAPLPPTPPKDPAPKTVDPKADTALLDPTKFLLKDEKKITAPGTPETKTVTPPPAAGGSPPGSAKTGNATGVLSEANLTRGTAADALRGTTPTTYVTKKDDTLWDLAQRFFRDGSKWQEIVKANPGLPPQGNRLPEGYTLVIPPPPPAPKTETLPPPPPPPNTRAYTIKAGDKLWNLALKFYGEGPLYKEILAANAGLDGAKLPVGKVIYLPVIPGKGPQGLDSGTPSTKS